MTSATTFKPFLQQAIADNGGWVNAHAHIDRAFTISPETLPAYQQYSLQQKWDLVDTVKRSSSEETYYRRCCQAIESMLAQGVTALGSFIDIDPICEDRAIRGAMRAREQYPEIEIRFANQVLKGLMHPEARKWFDIAVDYVDIIGGLPYRDELEYGKGAESMDILMETAKKHQKRLHVHVDQFNSPQERETELLCDKIIEHNMQGKVTAIHGISIGAHPKPYREALYQKMREAQLQIITCPTAWIDSSRNETLMPFHNALTPVDELVPAQISVALGTDNICDYMVPFSEGDMWSELMLIATGCRFTDLQALIRMASENGRKVLGLEPK